jgi:opacity protein-like surface antigen
MSLRRALAAALLLIVVAPASARADGMIIPFLGVNFGGSCCSELGNAIDAKRYDWGASFTYMGGGVLGIEGDIGYSPDFFGRTDIGSSSVLTATGNLLVGIPIGGQTGVGIRPYALVGLGVVRTKVDGFNTILSLDNSKAAWDFGGGVMFFFGTHVGVRGDVRYFRTFGGVDFLIPDSKSLDFARGSAGLILRF